MYRITARVKQEQINQPGRWFAPLRHRFLTLYFLTSTLLIAQKNLVPNPGFDSLKFCPTNYGQVTLAAPWQNGQGTPDIFHECSSASDYRVPNPFSCQNLPAQNGQGYAGITVYGTREFVETNLTEPLEGGKQYYVRFFVAADEDCLGGPRSASDAIALLLKRTNNPAIDNFETIVENSGTIIKDTMQWVKISGCYFARGTEGILRIGNPKLDHESNYETNQPNYPYPENYMFVDDVFIGTFDPFPDTVLLCAGVPTKLDAMFLEAEYQWNTGATEAVLLASDTGRYVVQATLEGCVFRDVVTVASVPSAHSVMLDDADLCDNESLLLTAPLLGRYQWSNGSTAAQTIVKNPGQYDLTVTNECGEFLFSQKVEAADCRCRVYVPNVFSPNDDGSNDSLEVSIGCEYPFEVKRFDIYDRWGSLVFSTKSSPPVAWDGEAIGQKASPGVYTWYLTYDLLRNGTARKITEYGDLTLLR